MGQQHHDPLDRSDLERGVLGIFECLGGQMGLDFYRALLHQCDISTCFLGFGERPYRVDRFFQ